MLFAFVTDELEYLFYRIFFRKKFLMIFKKVQNGIVVPIECTDSNGFGKFRGRCASEIDWSFEQKNCLQVQCYVFESYLL